METENKGLTECREIMRGFTGSRGLSNEPTKAGRRRIRFDLVSGETDISKMRYPIWRHCVGYDDVAGYLHELKPCEYLKVEGYIVPEVKRDYSGKPIFLFTGEPVIDNILIVQTAVRLNHRGRQYKMFEAEPSDGKRMVETVI